MRFDWTSLRVFLHVCEAGSMTAAAERCHLTLAAVSARVRCLEDAAGALLLRRQARGVSPTPAGELLARHARLLLDQVQRLERELVHARGGPERTIIVLANSSALARPLAQALAGAGEGPLLVRESPSEATVQAIRCGAADVGIVSDAIDTAGLVLRDLGADPLVLVVPREHALAGRESVAFHDALAHPWIAWGEQGALSAHLLMRAAALGVQLRARIVYPDAGGVLQLVGRGLGLTVLPQAVVDQHARVAGVSCVRLQERWAQRRLLTCHLARGDVPHERIAGRIARYWE